LTESMPVSLYSKAHIRDALSPTPSAVHEDMLWLAGAPPEIMDQVRGLLPPGRVPAAVLVPLVERDAGLTVSAFPADASKRKIPIPGTRRCARRMRKSACRRITWNSPATCRITWWSAAFA